MYELIALTDKPSTESFGMCAILVRSQATGQLLTLGRPDGRPHHAGIDDGPEGEAMIRASCLDVRPSGTVLAAEHGNPVAAWAGRKFLEECERLKGPPPECPWCARPVPPPDSGRPTVGWYWLEDPATAYGRLERWTVAAARKAVRDQDQALCDLLHWCLPEHEHALAARWWLAPEGAPKGQALAEAMRFYNREKRSAEALATRYRELAEGMLR